jgi:hypothetical protein
VPVIKVQTASAKDLRREIELASPVFDDRVSEKVTGPPIHLAGDLFGYAEEHPVARYSQLQISMIVERHRVDLTERVFAVKHPSICSREQRIRYVPQSILDACARFRSGSGSLYPLPLEIGRNVASLEVPFAGVSNGHSGSGNYRFRIKKRDTLPVLRASQSPRAPRLHQRSPVDVERRQNLERFQYHRSEDIPV